MAFSGASTRGPLRSTVMSGCTVGRPRTSTVRRRGVAKNPSPSQERRASSSRDRTLRLSSSAPPACIRAGISSERTSNSRSGMARAHRCAVTEVRKSLVRACDLSGPATLVVMPGLVPGISLNLVGRTLGNTWMAGTSPAMTWSGHRAGAWELLEQDTRRPPPARPRSRPWPARGRGRCRPRVPPR